MADAFPGLSVLVPVFNRDVTLLVRQVVEQAASWPGPVEVDLLDDGSAAAFQELNAALASLPGVRYRQLGRNVGRAAIRNQLGAAARHPWLLLLDNDSLLPDGRFLTRYAAARTQAEVLVGGTCYQPAPPPEPALYLRWLYGQAREARTAAERQRAPFAQLAINNALITAAVFRRFPLDARLTGYGHEDTKFGLELATAGIAVRHLDNPVLHDGLEPAAAFLLKSEQAVRNLARVHREDDLGTDSRLLRLALRLRKLGLAAAAQTVLAGAEPGLRRNLLSSKPSLRAFDLLKLRWLLPLL